MRAASGVSSSLALMSRTAVDTVLPPQCLVYDALVTTSGSLCPDCWDDAVFVSAPFCSACGVPFEFEQGPAALCGACICERPVFSRAQALTREAGCTEKLRAAALSRRRSTPTQGGLNASQRRLNVRGAFVATPRYTDDLAGRHVLLIDDVYTTGATLEACTKVLLGAGATQVDVLVLARVDRPR